MYTKFLQEIRSVLNQKTFSLINAQASFFRTNRPLVKDLSIEYRSISEGLLLRGSVGMGELSALVEHKKLGVDNRRNGKTPHLCVPTHVRQNDSTLLYSATTELELALTYANFGIVPKTGVIFIFNVPPVFTDPHYLLQLDENQFTTYQTRLSEYEASDTKLHCIKKMTRDNSEITAITDFGIDMADIKGLAIIEGTGIIGQRCNFQPRIKQIITNPGYQSRSFALKIVISPNPLDSLNKTAHTLNLIPETMRLLTLNDAETIMNAPELFPLQYGQSEKTHILSSVPADIPEGHPLLIAYAKNHLLNLFAETPVKECENGSEEIYTSVCNMMPKQ